MSGPPTLAPLRKIVRYFTDPLTGVEREEFECGHVRNVKQDIYGPTNAVRRRCTTCLKHMRAAYYESFKAHSPYSKDRER